MDIEKIILQICETLKQGSDLIAGLDPEIYRSRDQRLCISGVGAHFRHILDFYECALSGYRSCIDYNNRKRDTLIENSRETAVSGIRSTMKELGSRVGKIDGNLPVKVLAADSSPDGNVISSTVGRELQYLLDHTIHHYAIIAIILKAQNIPVPEEFGVAPSTLKYWESTGRLKASLQEAEKQ